MADEEKDLKPQDAKPGEAKTEAKDTAEQLVEYGEAPKLIDRDDKHVH